VGNYYPHAPPMDDAFRIYKVWAAEATLYVTIDVLLVNTGARHSALEGHTAANAQDLLVLVACALQRLAFLSEEEEIPLDPTVLGDPIESFSFSKISKRSLAAHLCTAHCDMNNTMLNLLHIGGIILPLERQTIYITFVPTADDMARTSLPKESCMALKTIQKSSSDGASPSTSPPPSLHPRDTSSRRPSSLFSPWSNRKGYPPPPSAIDIDRAFWVPPPPLPRPVAIGAHYQSTGRRQ